MNATLTSPIDVSKSVHRHERNIYLVDHGSQVTSPTRTQHLIWRSTFRNWLTSTHTPMHLSIVVYTCEGVFWPTSLNIKSTLVRIVPMPDGTYMLLYGRVSSYVVGIQVLFLTLRLLTHIWMRNGNRVRIIRRQALLPRTIVWRFLDSPETSLV